MNFFIGASDPFCKNMKPLHTNLRDLLCKEA
jgi:hypothetical protein